MAEPIEIAAFFATLRNVLEKATDKERMRILAEVTEKESERSQRHTDLPTSREYPEQFAVGMQALLETPAMGQLTGKHIEAIGKLICPRAAKLRDADSILALCLSPEIQERLSAHGLERLNEEQWRGLSEIMAVSAQSVDHFDSADYYDCGRDPENLSHKTVVEAIAAHFWSRREDDRSVNEDIDWRCPLTVAAYRHVAIPDDWFKLTALRLADDAKRMFEETDLLGNPNGGSVISAADVAQYAEQLEPTVRAMMAGVKPWHCEQVATRQYSAEQVEAMLREDKP